MMREERTHSKYVSRPTDTALAQILYVTIRFI
jgi:hypothetical protein